MTERRLSGMREDLGRFCDGMSHSLRKEFGGTTWCPLFDEIADDGFAAWPSLIAPLGGARFYFRDAKANLATLSELPPQGPDHWDLLFDVQPSCGAAARTEPARCDSRGGSEE